MITSVHNEMATSRGKMRHPHPPFDDLSLRIAVQEWLLRPVDAESKYGHISDWDTSRVCDMRGLFLGARTFDQPLRWDTRNVHAMSGMFFNATAFNQPLPWDTRNVRIMSEMFCGATTFNQPLVWNTHNVHEMTGMFCGATAFNQPLSWDMRNVQSMRNMFLNASAFNQPLHAWYASQLPPNFQDMPRMLLDGATASHPPMTEGANRTSATEDLDPDQMRAWRERWEQVERHPPERTVDVCVAWFGQCLPDCGVCLHGPCSVVFTKCRHLVCDGCYTRMRTRKCPLCREVSDGMHLYEFLDRNRPYVP